MEEKSDNIEVTVIDPDKSYLIGEYRRIPEAKLFAQACCLGEKQYSIRVIVSHLDCHHEIWRPLCMFWNLKKELKKEDFIFESLDLVKAKLEELCEQNNWPWYY